VTDEQTRLRRLAELSVKVAANVQPGQRVVVCGQVAHAPLMREIARAAYRLGAREVDPFYLDRHFTRAAVELGPEESLGESAPWNLALLDTLSLEEGAFILVDGAPEPRLMADLPGELIGKAVPRKYFAQWAEIVGDRKVNWAIVPGPNAGWATEVFGKPDVEALWTAVEKALRLDRDDPVAAWREHIDRLHRVAGALNERRFDSLRYRGPGTDLTVGLLPSSRWDGAETTTTFGVAHVANIPTEEVYTSPDKRRAEGRLRSTMPLQLLGTMVRNLELEFHDGRIVEVKASEGADVIRGELASDPNADRLGEVALVDAASEVGKLGLTFYNSVFDENATCHIAYGDGFEYCIDDEHDREAGLNTSSVHTDFMVGGPEVEIDGQERGGAWVPIIRDNHFQIG